MARFLIDEDLPRSLARRLEEADHQAEHVRDVGLTAASDDEVFRFAQRRGAVLVSADLGFGNITRFPLGQHVGIVVVRMPHEIQIGHRVAQIVELIGSIPEGDLPGTLAIVQPGRVRIRRAR